MNESKPIIKVLGAGGAGCNAVAYMSHAEIEGVEFLGANTDAQDLEKLVSVKRIQLGKEETKGLGAGADPKVGRKSAEENREEIRQELEGSNLLFISAGMGGGTGTGAAPVIAEIAKELGMLVIAVVTKPFDYERQKRMKQAEQGIEKLKEHVDSLIVIPNDQLRDVIPLDTPLSDVFQKVDEVLHKAIQGIAEIVTKRGVINIDFNDLKTIMNNSGNAMIGMGIATGENKATEAALQAIHSPLLEEKNLSNAQRAIINVSLGTDSSLKDFEAVGQVVKQITAEDAEVIMGTSVDEKLNEGIKVTIIATDFKSEDKIKEETKQVIIEEPKPIIKEEPKNEIDELPSFLKKPSNSSAKDDKEIKEDQIITKKEDPVEEKEKKETVVAKKTKEIKEQKSTTDIPHFLKKRI